jgi:PPOX class probable FMN-dependent enzyme
MPFDHAVTDVEALRERYRQPHPLVLDKQIDHIDDAARAFVEASPFVVVATTGPGGTDASPRGGAPGFVAVLDQGRLAMGDLAGNNRLDTHTNVLGDPRIGLIFLVPGVEETLRVNGRATLTTDPDVLEAVTVDGRRPPVAIGIDVEECFIHCAKAFRRSGLWDPSTWPAAEDRPSAARALRDHIGLDASPEVIAADLEAGYQVTLWEPGG